MKSKLFYLIFFISISCFSQWNQIDNSINGNSNKDLFGKSIAISGDGNRIIVGATQDDGGRDVGNGYVKVYQKDGTSISQLGSTLNGFAIADHFGFSVDISKDGNIIAIGAPLNNGNAGDNNTGAVKIYQYINNDWSLLGNEIIGEASGDEFGYSLSLNSNGTIIAVGARRNDTDGIGNENDGHIRVYKLESGSWTQIGSDIDGTDGKQFGTSVSISGDGNTLIMGALSNGAGAKVYKNISGNWQQIGSELLGITNTDRFGESVDISDNGQIIAVGAPKTSGLGYVKIYENMANIWTQIGSTISGDESSDQFGKAISLSLNGDFVAIGAPFNASPFSNAGSVKIFRNVANSWVQLDNEIGAIDGTDFKRQIGSAVALSSNASILAIGVPEENGTGFGTDGPGMFRVYENDSFLPKPFITKWKTTTTNESITIPTKGTGYNYNIDWGDGTTESAFTGDATHTYVNAGNYEVKISGNFPRINFNETNLSNKNKLIEISQWGSNSWDTMQNAFSQCQNLEITATDAPDLSNVTNLSSMFYDCDKMNSNINHWDVSNVTEMGAMFYLASSFNQPLNDWNVSKVTSMSSLFKEARAFNQPLNDWDVSNVTNMDNMFTNTPFNQPLNNWNTSKVTSMYAMFWASAFNQSINDWNVSNVESMRWMFRNNTAFNQPLDKWDVSKVTNMNQTFAGTTSFDQSLKDWDISSVTTMNNFLFQSGLSTIHYDETLIAWSTLPNLKQNLNPNFGSSKYCDGGIAKSNLETNYNWSIADSGKDCTNLPLRYNIPDVNFEQALIDLGFDTNGVTGNILATDADKIEELQISNPQNNTGLPNVNSKISDLSGIENFVNLWLLRCNDNEITNLDLSNNTNLRFLNCKNNNLESLNVKNGNNSNVTSFNAENNPDLTCIRVDNQQYSLDNWFFIDEQTGFSEDCTQNNAISNYYTTVPDSEFEQFLIAGKIDTIQDGKFRTKDAINIQAFNFGTPRQYQYKNLKGIEVFKKLKEFTTTSSLLEEVDFSKNLNLETLLLNSTKIDSLDVSMLTKLKKLNCIGGNTKMKYLNVSGAINLEELQAHENELTVIDVSTNTKLTWLNVGDNQLTAIDVTNLPDLETFGCYDNRIKTLNLSNNPNLRLMYAHRNYMEWINIKVGNSNFVTDFNATSNPNLKCVQIDNPTTSRVQFFESRLDDNVIVSDNCSLQTPKNFITKWETTSANEVISIQSGYAEHHNFDIDWGDGSKTIGVNGTANHSYTSPGEYSITLSGNVYEIRMGDKANLKEVVQWGTNRWKYLQFAFANSTNMQITATDTPDLSLALNLNSMFKDCTTLDYNFGTWDISSVIRMPDMLNNTSVSEENYDATLLGWRQLSTVPRNMQFGAEGVYYCDNEAIKNELIDDYNWTITDAGRGCGFQTIAIPDSNFEQALIDLGHDTNGLNGNILQSEAEAVESLNISNKSIVDLTGIEAFTALITLNVSNNSLTSLDLSNNPLLDSLNAERNNIETILFSENSKMYSLDVERNNLTSLDLSDLSDLNILYCGLNTSLTSLDVSNNLKLEWLDCNSTQSLSTLILGANTLLRHLDIDGHKITALDVSANTNLQTLECAFGNLSSLTLNNKLKTLSATQNNLSSLNSANAADLETIDVDRNSLASVDLSNNIKLKEIKISDNNLNAIDLTTNINLEILSIQSNNLTQLDVSNNTKLTSLFASENNLNTINFGTNAILRVVDVDANNLSEIDLAGLSNLRILKVYQNSLTNLDIENNVLLEELWLSENNLESLNVSTNSNLLHFEAKNNSLTYLNYKNGNNTAITKEEGRTKVNRLFDVSGNPNLNCIEVDDVAHANEHFSKDDTARFKLDCTPRPFITKWKTTTANESISLPIFIYGNYDYTIDWGDGNIENNVTSNNSHTYVNSGEYLVKISGEFPRILMNNSSAKEKLLEVTQWGSIEWEFLSFNGCANLQITATDAPDLSNVTSFTSMFKNCTTLNANINHWDVSNITNMNNLFEGATSYNQPLNDWDVSSLTGTALNSTFKNATSFNQPLNNWDVSNVTSLISMFEGASSFNQPLNNWDVSNVAYISRMFLNASSFNGALNDWNTSKLEAMYNTFDSAIAFNQPLNNWNVSSVISFSNCFNNTSKFNQPLDQWNVSSATDFNNMFRGATKFNQPLGNWDVSNVTIMVDMFSNTNMSVINYDKTLNGWASLPSLKTRVHLDANLTNYCNSETARNTLRTNFIWDIDDAGKDCSKIDTPQNVNGMWNDPTNWASGEVPSSSDNVVIPSGTTLQIGNEISEIKSLENEGTIVINPTYSLKSMSNMVNNGTIIMDSSTDDSAVLFVEGTSTGNIVYKRGGLKANKWSLVTPPVSGQKIKEFATEVDNDIRKNETVSPVRYAIAYYDDTEDSGSKWKYFTESISADTTFTAGESYGISRATDGSVTFTGTLTTSNTSKTLKSGEWNAIGNPFTTYYPANKNGNSSFLNDNYDILDDNFKGLYIWDAEQNKYAVVSELDLQNRSFPPGQGFFIKVKTGENTIEFKETKRSLKPNEGTTQFQKNQDKYIQIFVDNGKNKVATDIKFLNNASLGFDVGLDIGNFNASFDIYTKLVDKSNIKNYTIQSIPLNSKKDIVVPLGIATDKSEVIFSTKHQNLGSNTILYLEDKLNNKLVNITNATHVVDFSNSENSSDRFYLHITNQRVLGIEDSLLHQIKIYASNKTLFVRGVNEESNIEIVNLLGQKIFTTLINTDKDIDLSGVIKTGVYLINLKSKNISKTKKIIIK